jgi:hypothetical protein
MATNFVSELERLANAVESDAAAAEEVSLPAIGERIAKSLGVKVDEVAILGLSQKWKHLHFLVPAALKNVGYIPMSSNSALAARTAREMRAETINNFASVRHARVFEGVRGLEVSGESIQKIISAPILCDGKAVGVMQVSRKGPNAAEAGPDFTLEDVNRVQAICRPLGKLVRSLSGE